MDVLHPLPAPLSPLRRFLRALPRSLATYGAAFLGVMVATVIAEVLYRTFHTNRLSMVFLGGILITAVTLGSYPAYFAAILAFFIYNFYLVEPRFSFEPWSAEDVLVLVVFLAVAMLTGGLAGRLRDEAKRNKAWAHTSGALFAASRELSDAGDESAIRARLVRHIAEAARGQAMLLDPKSANFAPEGFVATPAQQAKILGINLEDAPPDAHSVTAGQWQARPLRADGLNLGIAAWRGPPDPETGATAVPTDDDRLIKVLVDLGAAAIIRARLGAARAEVEALARTEQLRNALLSSISHDLRTPLAAILASASSLKDFGEKFTPATRIDLVTTIEEEAERLNRFVANLLSMTKLESGALDLDLQDFDSAEVLNRLSSRLETQGLNLQRDFAAQGLGIIGDPILLEQALGNVLENAFRYGPPQAPVVLRSRAVSDQILIEVEDEGPGVPDEDLERIFEKFFRSPGVRKIQGTGLGLSIARGLIEAMNGSICAHRRKAPQSGLTVAIALKRSLIHGQ